MRPVDDEDDQDPHAATDQGSTRRDIFGAFYGFPVVVLLFATVGIERVAQVLECRIDQFDGQEGATGQDDSREFPRVQFERQADHEGEGVTEAEEPEIPLPPEGVANAGDGVADAVDVVANHGRGELRADARDRE